MAGGTKGGHAVIIGSAEKVHLSKNYPRYQANNTSDIDRF
jgi:hypothetical protein